MKGMNVKLKRIIVESYTKAHVVYENVCFGATWRHCIGRYHYGIIDPA